VEVTNSDGKAEKIPVYIGNEGVRGTVNIKLESSTKKIEHTGIKVTLLGSISNYFFNW
jgi:hypothetical protein